MTMNVALAIAPALTVNEVGALVRAVTPKVVAAVRAVLGHSHADVDDAVQLSLIAFIQALPAFRGDCDPAGYARVIAVRTAIALRKRHRAIALRHDGYADADAVLCARPSPAEATSADQRRTVMREILAEMPEEQSETLALRVCLGWTLEEIAKETGAPLNTVRSRLRLAKERLRERIEGDVTLRETFERE
jgi:RNA polymerase sigma factor (sigma-70 family)